MFAKTIIDSDAFIDMPLSTQALYFHLSMRADDEGFINSPKKIQRMVGATEDDLKLLIAKNFIIPFESGVVVIKHWKIHNYIRKDRITETVYQEEKKQLVEKENGAYTFNKYELLEIEPEEETPRQLAYKKSSLPYSFNYKMKRAFEGRTCPICKKVMSSANKTTTPTIQHNLPISKGGEHELYNISIICLSCNTSIQDKETNNLNNEEVIKVWDRINELEKNNINWFWNLDLLKQWQANDSQVAAQVRLGKDSIGKVNNKEGKKFIKPTIEEIEAYCKERNNGINANAFYDFYEAKDWFIGKNKMRDFKACIRTWEQRNKKDLPTWINKEETKQEMTLEEKQELEELLKDFK